MQLTNEINVVDKMDGLNLSIYKKSNSVFCYDI